MPPERRLLFLAPYPPRRDALHGGARAMAHLIGGLAARHRVALLCLRGDDEAGIESEVAVPAPYTGPPDAKLPPMSWIVNCPLAFTVIRVDTVRGMFW